MSGLGEMHALIRLLVEYGGGTDSNPSRAGVTHLEHALRCATLAAADGADDQAVTVALLHDAGRPLSDVHHGELVAEALRCRVAPEWYQALRHHGEFQADILHGTSNAERHAAEPWYDHAVRLARWDAAAFDPATDPLPLTAFAGQLAEVFADD